MKKGILTLLMMVLVFTVTGWARDNDNNANNNDERTKAEKRLDDAATELNQLTSAPDNGIPQTILAKAQCVAIVPSMIKGGFIFGAEYGRGVATCRTDGKWSAPAFFSITGGSWGAQIGGEAVDLTMLFMTDEGARKLMSANWKIGGDVGVAAGPYGRQGSVSTDWKFNSGILTYSRAQGVYAGATLNGANVHVDETAMRSFYGRHPPNFRAVLSGKVPPPPQSHQFLAAVRQDFHEAEANK